MLPRMLNVGAEDSGMFYDFDHDQFLEPLSDSEDTQSVIVSPLLETDESGLERDIPLEIDGELEARSALSTQAPLLEGLSQTVETTVNYMRDGSVQVVEHTPCHPAITGTLKRRV